MIHQRLEAFLVLRTASMIGRTPLHDKGETRGLFHKFVGAHGWYTAVSLFDYQCQWHHRLLIKRVDVLRTDQLPTLPPPTGRPCIQQSQEKKATFTIGVARVYS